MSKLKVQMKSKVQMPKWGKEKILTFSPFAIHLTFACLPCTSAVQGLPAGRDVDIRISDFTLDFVLSRIEKS
jgi:hypothetical protein